MREKKTADDIFEEFEAWVLSGKADVHPGRRCPFDKKACRKDCAAYGSKSDCLLIPSRR